MEKPGSGMQNCSGLVEGRDLVRSMGFSILADPEKASHESFYLIRKKLFLK